MELRQPVYKVVEFLPTPSARRATPAPFALVAIFFRFLPTPSARRATEPAAYCLGSKKFLPTPSARRATGAVFVFARYTDISTHALREEGDRVFLRSICPLRNFYPRPPRGGRRGDKLHPGIKLVFLSTPSARRATLIFCLQPIILWLFLSTPSARRATLRTVCRCHQADISIHALREEGDRASDRRCAAFFKFLSTPSARRATASKRAPSPRTTTFLSTPSARRATGRFAHCG